MGRLEKLKTAIREIPIKKEISLQKDRAHDEAKLLAKLLLQLPFVPESQIHRTTVSVSGDRQLTVHLINSGDAKTLPMFLKHANPSDDLELWIRGPNLSPRVIIGYNLKEKRLVYYQEKDSWAKTMLDVHGATWNNDGYLASKYGSHSPFDTTFQSLVYCDIANRFTEARQAIEKLPSTGQVK